MIMGSIILINSNLNLINIGTIHEYMITLITLGDIHISPLIDLISIFQIILTFKRTTTLDINIPNFSFCFIKRKMMCNFAIIFHAIIFHILSFHLIFKSHLNHCLINSLNFYVSVGD